MTSAAVPPSLAPISDCHDPSLPALSALLASTSPPLRLQAELEFLSLLANPFYLHHLAAQSYLSQPSFLTYLSSLLHSYSAPPLLRLLPFPHCLSTLRLLLSSADFRRECGRREYVELMHAQQFWHWRSFRYARYREELERRERQQGRHTDERATTQADNTGEAREGGAVGHSVELRREAVKMEAG